MIGQKLGHYLILEKIGAGGMGEVYRAHDEHLERDVAIKVLPAGTLADESARKRFRKEALALSKLNHPNVATVFDFDTQAGVDFLVMELVAGENLGDRLPGRPLPEKDILRIGAQMAEGLAAAHEQNIIHRDLKPGNLRLTPNGRLKILDFGLARLLQPFSATAATESLTESQAVVGTLPYMSPEQLQGEKADARSDIYAAGCVLYELATGRRPFQETLSTALTDAILHKPPPPPGRVNVDISPRLEEIIIRCLQKDPDIRYQTARDLRADLQRSAVGTAVDVTPRRRQARRARFAFAAAAVFALLGGLWFAGSRLRIWGPAVDPRTLLILPMEIRGQVEGPEYAGRAFAEALAVNLAQAKSLNVLPVPEVGELARGGPLTHVEAARNLRAGLLLSGALRREGETLYASLTLVDTSQTRMLWGTEKSEPKGSLAGLAALLAREVAAELGISTPRVYEYYLYDTGPPAMAASPEMIETLSAVRRFEVERGLKATERLVEAFPNEPQAYALQGCALLKAAWQTWPSFPQRRAYQQVMLALNRLDPNSPWDEYFDALLLSSSGKNQEAVEIFTKLLDRDDLSPAARGDILSFRGQNKATLGDLTGALAELEEALRLDPTNDYTYTNLAYVLELAGRREEAATRARQALALNPTSYQTNFSLALYLTRLGRWQEALAPAGKACEVGRGQLECALYAVALLRAGHAEEAQAAALHAMSLPESTYGVLTLARYHALAGNRANALRFLRRGLELESAFTEAHVKAISEDEGLAALRGDPGFEAILGEIKRRVQSQSAGR